MRVHVCVQATAHMWRSKGIFVESVILLTSCGFWGSSLDHRAGVTSAFTHGATSLTYLSAAAHLLPLLIFEALGTRAWPRAHRDPLLSAGVTGLCHHVQHLPASYTEPQVQDLGFK